MEDSKTKRRTRWQAAAHRRYPKLCYLGGDGDTIGWEAWVVMAKCERAGTRHWAYRLAANQSEAEAILTRWQADGCGGYQCNPGDHNYWRIR
jgi:hypothetical protein